MATQVRIRRGTTAEHSTFAGASAEITFDTDKNIIVGHDGVTLGGFPLARADQVTPVRGSNANGEYVRFADGTQICTGSVTLTYLNGAILRGEWTFPSSFASSPIVSAIISSRSTAPSLAQICAMECAGVSTTAVGRFDVCRTSGQTDFVAGNTIILSVQAVGRWF